jgi:hypothetical protein
MGKNLQNLNTSVTAVYGLAYLLRWGETGEEGTTVWSKTDAVHVVYASC